GMSFDVREAGIEDIGQMRTRHARLARTGDGGIEHDHLQAGKCGLDGRGKPGHAGADHAEVGRNIASQWSIRGAVVSVAPDSISDSHARSLCKKWTQGSGRG